MCAIFLEIPKQPGILLLSAPHMYVSGVLEATEGGVIGMMTTTEMSNLESLGLNNYFWCYFYHPIGGGFYGHCHFHHHILVPQTDPWVGIECCI